MIQSPKVRRGQLCDEVMATVACDSGSVSEPGIPFPGIASTNPHQMGLSPFAR